MTQYSLSNIRKKLNPTIRRWFSVLLAAFTITILLGQAKVAQGCASFFVDPATNQQICLDDVLTRPEPATESPRTLNNGWSEWESLGGPLGNGTGVEVNPAVAANKDGRLEAFVLASDAGIWHKWQLAPNGGWSEWESFNGPLSNGNRIGVRTVPTVVANTDGRLEIFVLANDRAIWHKWQLAPNSNWSEWESLGTVIGIDGRPILTSVPTVGVNRDGHMEVFARSGRGIDSDILWHTEQLAPNGNWSGWSLFGAGVRDVPAIGMNQDGRLEIFAGQRNARFQRKLRHRSQITPNGPWADWEKWSDAVDGVSTTPAVGMNQDGRLEVFARGGPNSELLHRRQLAPNGNWPGTWSSLGGLLAGGYSFSTAPAVGTNKDGRLEAFVLARDSAIWHKWQTSPNGNWSGWESLGGSFTQVPAVGVNKGPAVGSNQDGRLEVFVQGKNNQLWHKWQR